MARIVVDPVTRIEGHLRIEAQVDGGRDHGCVEFGHDVPGDRVDPPRTRSARSLDLGAADLRRVHHGPRARLGCAVEDALDIEIPDNARLVRNIIAATQTIQDHVVHFYHLHALDWVDIVSALKADPAKTSTLAESISDWPKSSAKYFKGVQDRSTSSSRASNSASSARVIGATRRIGCRRKRT